MEEKLTNLSALVAVAYVGRKLTTAHSFAVAEGSIVYVNSLEVILCSLPLLCTKIHKPSLLITLGLSQLCLPLIIIILHITGKSV